LTWIVGGIADFWDLKYLAMKKIALFLTLFLSFFAKSQFQIDSLYSDKEQLLINQKVIIVDSVSREELINRIKNWGGVSFVNLKEVLVSETQDQLVFTYVSSGFYVKSMGITSTLDWYVRMVVQVKDGRIRVQQFDDGNVFRPGSYSGGVSVPATQARVYHLNDYFVDGVARKMHNDGFIKFKVATQNTLNSLESAIKSPTSDAGKDEW
jgi:hypothetical protein